MAQNDYETSPYLGSDAKRKFEVLLDIGNKISHQPRIISLREELGINKNGLTYTAGPKSGTKEFADFLSSTIGRSIIKNITMIQKLAQKIYEEEKVGSPFSETEFLESMTWYIVFGENVIFYLNNRRSVLLGINKLKAPTDARTPRRTYIGRNVLSRSEEQVVTDGYEASIHFTLSTTKSDLKAFIEQAWPFIEEARQSRGVIHKRIRPKTTRDINNFIYEHRNTSIDERYDLIKEVFGSAMADTYGGEDISRTIINREKRRRSSE